MSSGAKDDRDITDELRELVRPTGVTSIARESLFTDAADEIDRLRAVLSIVREARSDDWYQDDPGWIPVDRYFEYEKER